jgi:hypothetical protein
MRSQIQGIMRGGVTAEEMLQVEGITQDTQNSLNQLEGAEKAVFGEITKFQGNAEMRENWLLNPDALQRAIDTDDLSKLEKNPYGNYFLEMKNYDVGAMMGGLQKDNTLKRKVQWIKDGTEYTKKYFKYDDKMRALKVDSLWQDNRWKETMKDRVAYLHQKDMEGQLGKEGLAPFYKQAMDVLRIQSITEGNVEQLTNEVARQMTKGLVDYYLPSEQFKPDSRELPRGDSGNALAIPERNGSWVFGESIDLDSDAPYYLDGKRKTEPIKGLSTINVRFGKIPDTNYKGLYVTGIQPKKGSKFDEYLKTLPKDQQEAVRAERVDQLNYLTASGKALPKDIINMGYEFVYIPYKGVEGNYDYLKLENIDNYPRDLQEIPVYVDKEGILQEASGEAFKELELNKGDKGISFDSELEKPNIGVGRFLTGTKAGDILAGTKAGDVLGVSKKKGRTKVVEISYEELKKYAEENGMNIETYVELAYRDHNIRYKIR